MLNQAGASVDDLIVSDACDAEPDSWSQFTLSEAAQEEPTDTSS